MVIKRKELKISESRVVRALLNDISRHMGRKAAVLVAGSLEIIGTLTNINTVETAAFVLAGRMPTKERAIREGIERRGVLTVKWREKELLQISDALDRIVMALAIKDPLLARLLPNGGGRKEVRANEIITELGWLLYGFPVSDDPRIKSILDSVVKVAEKTKDPNQVETKIEQIEYGLKRAIKEGKGNRRGF